MLLDQEDLQTVAADMREVIEDLGSARHAAVRRIQQILQRRTPDASSHFPHQWCDFASCVLGGHLCRVTKDDVQLVAAEKPGEFGRHIWLEHNGFNVDITCDQFDGAPMAPFVSKSKPWHDRAFPDQSRVPFASRSLMAPYFERARLALELATKNHPRLSGHWIPGPP